MKVLALVTDAFGCSGGIAQYNRDVLRAAACSASIAWIDVLPLVPLRTMPTSLPDRIDQLPVPASRVGYVGQTLRLLALGRYDLIFCAHLNLAPLAAAVAAIARIPFVVQLHGIEIWTPLSVVKRRALERSRAVLCVSRDTRRRALAAADLSPDAVHVLPNTVDSAFTPADRAAARRRFGLSSERVLLTVGRLDAREAYKGHDRVIAALPDLMRSDPDLVYLVGGEGDDRSRLESLARDAGVEHAVRWLGLVPDDALADLYRTADVFVMPSTGEGFGIVYLEAMACGTPAVGLDVGGAPDALGEGTLGHVADPDELPAAIRSALANPMSPRDIAKATTERFGFPNFVLQVDALLSRWRSPQTLQIRSRP